ncbi:MAG: FtsQ-type POTRA domain-containing protein [Candidatus Abyssobacteria bacterium SURF_17]|uniref:FtsQ-type POTRA domain-containing protein n=1 Tax=Candidatus Abyssobacteria bacterium SURF_17 TaxID=2093361 RepID=A0A419F7Q1_9BACT|nr:MAG: FtsQ-type POTRA domain-containing protein [Candidatus Abyssubacteria bacterium SURF_17]
MRELLKKAFKLLTEWDDLRQTLKRGDPRRIFVGRFSKGNTKIIQTANSAPKRRQNVKRRQRVLVARRERIARAVASGVKLVLLVIVVIVVTADVLSYLRSSPRFAIAHIGVTGNTHETAETIMQSSGAAEGMNIFSIDLTRAAESVEEIPRISRACVKRKLPNEIYIEVSERQPLALILSRQLLYIDGEGKVFAPFEPGDVFNAPIITGKKLERLEIGDVAEAEGVDTALRIVEALGSMGCTDSIRVSEINIDNPSNILMVAEQSGASIILGSGDMKGKLWRLAKVAEEIGRNEHLDIANLERVDLRFEATVPAKFKGS